MLRTADGPGCALGAAGGGFASVADALRVTRAAAGYLNSAAARDLESAARGEALEALGAISSLLGAAANGLLRRFDADDGHDADGYASAATWLAGKTHLGRKDDANAAVRRMRLLGRHRPQARGRQVRPEPGRRQAAGRPGLRDPRPGLMLQGVRDRTEFDWRF